MWNRWYFVTISQPFCCKDDVCHSGRWHLRLKIASAQCIYCRTKERVFRCDEGVTERQTAIQRTRERGGRDRERDRERDRREGERDTKRERGRERDTERDTMRARERDTTREIQARVRGREIDTEREIQRERATSERGGREIQWERHTAREIRGAGRDTERERGERDIRTDRQIDVQMTYVTPYFHFENSFEWKWL